MFDMYDELKKMSDLEFIINQAKNLKVNLGLFIEMPGFEKPEIIVNSPKNLDKKLQYYKITYNENLEHKNAKGIRIIGYMFC
jgi:hypothetical protein